MNDRQLEDKADKSIFPKFVPRPIALIVASGPSHIRQLHLPRDML